MILICSPAAVCRCARRTGSSVGNQDSLIPGPVSRLSPATSSHPCVVCRDHPVIHTIHTIHTHIHVLAVLLLGFSLLLLMISVRVQLRYVILTVICQLCPQIKLIAARLVIISLFHVVEMLICSARPIPSTGQSWWKPTHENVISGWWDETKQNCLHYQRRHEQCIIIVCVALCWTVEWKWSL